MSNNALKIEGLCKSFGKLKVLENVDLTVTQGERIAIIGGSGCGKSVFLRCIERLVQPDSGRIFIEDQEITAKGSPLDTIRRKMGMVYQNFYLFEHMNVMDNLCLAPTHLLAMPRKDAEEKAMELLREVGLAARAKEWPEHLSGGQKQRIAIARCLMMDPKIMLFDEPTSALDPTMVGEVLATIRSLSQKSNLTMLVVTHEMNFAKNFADRVLFFADHGIYEQGTPQQIFEAPQKEKTQQFIRKIKNFDYAINSRDYDLMALAGGIHRFCERYGIASEMQYQIQLCAEELVEDILTHLQENAIDIQFSAAFSEFDSSVQLHCSWAGKQYDPLTEGDELRRMLLMNAAQKTQHQYVNGRNELFMLLHT